MRTKTVKRTFFNFVSCTDNYTRVTDVLNSCIDHIFIDYISNLFSYVIKTDITDYYIVSLLVLLPTSINNNNFIENDTHNNTNILVDFSHLNKWLLSFSWNNFLLSRDVDIF